MAFRDFGYPAVIQGLGLTYLEADLFGAIARIPLPDEFVDRLHAGVDLGLAIDTEKARSEFIIAPVLLEYRRISDGAFGIFSGVEFNVDASRGLNGFCDFILTRSRLQSVLTTPVVSIVEAKNDNVRNGLGQCIATMVAAHEFNAKSATPVGTVHGVVTTGSAWKFLRLSGADLTLDTNEFYISEPGRIMGILAHILKSA